ncbi:MAG: DNA polymerase ligase N-terminal domain-containing protein [Planctomycetota bacterium]|jgi:hypothetical protein
MSNRFVILHHVPDRGEHFDQHWDLMIEQQRVLLTWQLARNPVGECTGPIAARRIADHRKQYLDYEGPISNNRGSVTRVEEGLCEIHRHEDREIAVTLEGKRLSGGYQIRYVGSDLVFEAVAS